jgi:hypothetical protein
MRNAAVRSAAPFLVSLKPCSIAAKARWFVYSSVNAANAFGTIKARISWWLLSPWPDLMGQQTGRIKR